VSTNARDKLQAAQQRMGELQIKLAALWAAGDAGEDVDLDDITRTQTALTVAERLNPSLQRLAQAEQQAEHEAAWQTIEAETLDEHRKLAAEFHQRLDTARAALSEVVDAALAVDRQYEGFRRDARRPPVYSADGTQQLHERHDVAVGQQLHTAPAGDLLLALASDGLDRAAANGLRAWGQYKQQFDIVRSNMVLPTDPRTQETE